MTDLYDIYRKQQEETDRLRQRIAANGEHLADGECQGAWHLLDGTIYYTASTTQIQFLGDVGQWAVDTMRWMNCHSEPLPPPLRRLLAVLLARYPARVDLLAVQKRHARLAAIYGAKP